MDISIEATSQPLFCFAARHSSGKMEVMQLFKGVHKSLIMNYANDLCARHMSGQLMARLGSDATVMEDAQNKGNMAVAPRRRSLAPDEVRGMLKSALWRKKGAQPDSEDRSNVEAQGARRKSFSNMHDTASHVEGTGMYQRIRRASMALVSQPEPPVAGDADHYAQEEEGNT